MLIKKDQQMPFVQQFTAELEMVDAEYNEIHSIKEDYLIEKSAILNTIEFSLNLARVLKSSYFD